MAVKRDSGEVLRFYYPYPKFPSVSVTGAQCALNCRHCMGHYLGHMPNVDSPSKLKAFSVKLEEEGGNGILVSGGSTREGKVPLERFYPTLRWMKENTGLIVELHTGLLDREQAEEIASTGIDIAAVDVVGSDETIKRVYGLDAHVEDYWVTLDALKEAGVPHVAPHVCVGLDHGEIRGEHRALEISSRIDPEVVVILGLIPTAGTPMADVSPPSPEDVSRIVGEARKLCPDADIAVGCMRSRYGKLELDERAIKAGARRIALPSNATVESAVRDGFEVKVFDGCCAIPRSMDDRILRADPL